MQEPDGSKDLGIMGYVDPWSVHAGQRLRCMVSSREERFTAQIVHLVNGGPRPASEDSASSWRVIESPVNAQHQGRLQPVLAGSYAVACGRAASLAGSRFLSILAWVWATAPGQRLQGLVSVTADDRTIGLGLDRAGAPAFYMREADSPDVQIVTTAAPLVAQRWYLLGASLDVTTGAVEVFQRPLRPHPLAEPDADGAGTLSLRGPVGSVAEFTLGAAWLENLSSGDGQRRAATGCFDGKIDRPVVMLAQLSAGETDSVRSGESLPDRLAAARLADWDMSQSLPTTIVSDVSGNGIHGHTVNSPGRAVTGHHWSGEFLDWRSAPAEYGAIYFHSDDLDDACWETTFEFSVPDSLASGPYGIRLSIPAEDYLIPFFVTPEIGSPRSDVCVLLPTFTYMAYSNFSSSAVDAEKISGTGPVLSAVDAAIGGHRELGWSLYNEHQDGSGICQVSRKRPMLDLQLEHMDPIIGGAWTFSSDMFLIGWLNANGVAFDVITDEDLHRSGADAIRDYRVVLTGSHPEYVSMRMLDALDAYSDGSGSLMYLGGNGFYWVTNTLPDRSHVIEIRRGHAGTRTWEGAPGEGHLSSTGEPGGIWRHRGRAPQALVGVGFCAQGGGSSSGYTQTEARSDSRARFLFRGVGPQEDIGAFGHVRGGAGNEIDRADRRLGTPGHALVVATSAGRHSDFYQHAVEEVPMMMPDQGGTSCAEVRADMVYFESGTAGGVFSVGSIDWTASLPHNNYDNNVSRITWNALDHFRSVAVPGAADRGDHEVRPDPS